MSISYYIWKTARVFRTKCYFCCVCTLTRLLRIMVVVVAVTEVPQMNTIFWCGFEIGFNKKVRIFLLMTNLWLLFMQKVKWQWTGEFFHANSSWVSHMLLYSIFSELFILKNNGPIPRLCFFSLSRFCDTNTISIHLFIDTSWLILSWNCDTLFWYVYALDSIYA